MLGDSNLPHTCWALHCDLVTASGEKTHFTHDKLSYPWLQLES